MSKGWWQLTAGAMVAVNVGILSALTYFLVAFKSNLDAVAESQYTCLAGRDAFDSIAAAEMVGRLDVASFILTMIGLFLAIFAFVGFWMIRREVVDQAAQIAANEARKVAQTIYANQPPPEQKGDKPDILSYIKNKFWRFSKPERSVQFDPSSVSTQGAVEETGDSDEKSE